MHKVSVDIEADGPCPGLYSMLSVGAVVIEEGLKRTFSRELRPISDKWQPEAMKVNGFTREQTLTFADPASVMHEFGAWVEQVGQGERVQFVSDNASFDFGFVSYYFHKFIGSCPFGWSPLSLTSLYKGFARNVRADFRRDGLRKTKHTHSALQDAIGNAEAMLEMQRRGMQLDLATDGN